MEIKLNSNIESVGRITGGQPKRVEQKTGTDAAVFAQSQALDKALASTPDVRSDAVEEARDKVSLSDYPPAETIKKIATLLAKNIELEN
jgi:ClpP class serine protease